MSHVIGSWMFLRSCGAVISFRLCTLAVLRVCRFLNGHTHIKGFMDSCEKKTRQTNRRCLEPWWCSRGTEPGSAEPWYTHASHGRSVGAISLLPRTHNQICGLTPVPPTSPELLRRTDVNRLRRQTTDTLVDFLAISSFLPGTDGLISFPKFLRSVWDQVNDTSRRSRLGSSHEGAVNAAATM